jgi:hypothetical protein
MYPTTASGFQFLDAKNFIFCSIKHTTDDFKENVPVKF